LIAEKARVVFEQEENGNRSRLIVNGDGKVSYVPVASGSQLEFPLTRGTTKDPQTLEAPRGDAIPVSGVTTPSETTTSSSDATAESAEQESVTLQGRLGRDAWFRNGDRPTAGFPLAVNGYEDTIWHKVVVFDEAAGVLREQARRGEVKKGRLVDVTGQHAVREETTDRGTKRITEFHATQITRVNATRQP
jgi:hypothetical protein